MSRLLKVFFIDDEYLIRKLLFNCVNWKDLGYEVVGESSGGNHALELVAETNPDLIFVDICMPNIDGIQLSKMILEQKSSRKIVILTGHQEFEYAREALKFGAFDLLLKPVNPKEIIAVSTAVREDIFQKQNHDEMVAQLKQRITEGYPYLRERFLSQLVDGKINIDEAENSLSYYKINLFPTNFSIAIIDVIPKVGGIIGDETEGLIQTMSILELLKNFISEDVDNVYYFVKDNKVVVLCNNLSMDLSSYMESFLEDINYVKDYEVTIGVSNEHTDVKYINTAYLQAQNALSYKIILGGGVVIKYQELSSSKETSISYDGSMEKISFFIKAGLADEAVMHLRKELNYFSKMQKVCINNLRAIAMRVLSECFSIQNEFEITKLDDFDDSAESFNKIFQINTLPEIEKYLIGIVQALTKKIINLQNYKAHSIVTEVRDYIDSHLQDTDLSLKTVAKKFFLNSSYLSRIYKNEIGVSFTEYIKNKRIEKAISILMQEDCKAYQVASRVGIEDPHYFGITFKNSTGMTFSEYKMKLKKDRDNES